MKMNQQRQRSIIRMATVLLLLSTAIASQAQTSTVTYQGRLGDGGNPATGNYDLQFALFDSLTAGNLVGTAQTVSNVSVTAGIFTVQLDFGASAFPGTNRWLEIRARLINTPSFTTLSPRQQITATPYAIRSLNASSADTVTVTGVPSGSGNYIQNIPFNGTPQVAAFSITGNARIGGQLTADQGVLGFRDTLYGVRGISISAAGLRGEGASPGSSAISAEGTSFFQGDTTPLGSFLNPGTGVAIGSVRPSNYGYIFAYDYQQNLPRALVLNPAGGNVGIGTTTPQSRLHVVGSSWFQGDNTPLPPEAGKGIVMGFAGDQGYIAAFDYGAAFAPKNLLLNNPGGNVGIGTATPTATLDVNGAGVFRPAGVASPRATSFGSPSGETGMTITGPSNRADVRFDGTTLKLLAGVGTGPPASTNGVVITTVGSVGIGTTTPFLNTKLDIVGGFLRLDSLAGGGDESLCRNSAAHTLATCSSSLRYKERIASYTSGLQLINRLRPITFSWKESGRPDLGLGAEEVAKVEPLLVTRNQEGAVEGVKYDRLNLILINAIKEQQKQIEELRAQNRALNSRLRSVESVVVRKQIRARVKRSVTTW